MNGKDYCNCDHALLLREALQGALKALAGPQGYSVERALEIISTALRADRGLQRAYEQTEQDRDYGYRRNPQEGQGWGSSPEAERRSDYAGRGGDPSKI